MGNFHAKFRTLTNSGHGLEHFHMYIVQLHTILVSARKILCLLQTAASFFTTGETIRVVGSLTESLRRTRGRRRVSVT